MSNSVTPLGNPFKKGSSPSPKSNQSVTPGVGLYSPEDLLKLAEERQRKRDRNNIFLAQKEGTEKEFVKAQAKRFKDVPAPARLANPGPRTNLDFDLMRSLKDLENPDSIGYGMSEMFKVPVEQWDTKSLYDLKELGGEWLRDRESRKRKRQSFLDFEKEAAKSGLVAQKQDSDRANDAVMGSWTDASLATEQVLKDYISAGNAQLKLRGTEIDLPREQRAEREMIRRMASFTKDMAVGEKSLGEDAAWFQENQNNSINMNFYAQASNLFSSIAGDRTLPGVELLRSGSLDPTAREKLVNFNFSTAQGLGKMFTVASQGISVMSKELDYAFESLGLPNDSGVPASEKFFWLLGKAGEEWIDTHYPTDERLEDDFWLTKFPNGMGSMAAFVFAGLGATNPMTATTLFGTTNAGGSLYEEARAKFPDLPERELVHELIPYAVMSGWSESLSLGGIVGRMGNAGSGKYIQRFARSVGEESFQEAAQGGFLNPYNDMVLDADGAVVGGTLGGMITGFVEATLGVKRRRRMGVAQNEREFNKQTFAQFESVKESPSAVLAVQNVQATLRADATEKDGQSLQLTPVRARTAQEFTVGKVAKKLGYEVVFVKGSAPLPTKAAISKSSPRTILIESNPDNNADTLSSIVTHEIVHGLEVTNPELYGKLESAVVAEGPRILDSLAKKTQIEAEKVRLTGLAARLKKDPETVKSEAVAEIFEELAPQTEFWNNTQKDVSSAVRNLLQGSTKHAMSAAEDVDLEHIQLGALDDILTDLVNLETAAAKGDPVEGKATQEGVDKLGTPTIDPKAVVAPIPSTVLDVVEAITMEPSGVETDPSGSTSTQSTSEPVDVLSTAVKSQQAVNKKIRTLLGKEENSGVTYTDLFDALSLDPTLWEEILQSNMDVRKSNRFGVPGKMLSQIVLPKKRPKLNVSAINKALKAERQTTNKELKSKVKTKYEEVKSQIAEAKESVGSEGGVSPEGAVTTTKVKNGETTPSGTVPSVKTNLEFRSQLKESFPGLSRSQLNTVATLEEAKASAWSKLTGKPVTEYFPTFFGSLKGGKVSDVGDKALFQTDRDEKLTGFMSKILKTLDLRLPKKNANVQVSLLKQIFFGSKKNPNPFTEDTLRWGGVHTFFEEIATVQGIELTEIPVSVVEEFFLLNQFALNTFELARPEYTTRRVQPGLSLPGVVEENNIELLIKADQLSEILWEDPHFEHINTLLHIRANIRALSGLDEEVFFLEEIQSDLHQAGKKNGYLPLDSELEKLIESEVRVYKSEMKFTFPPGETAEVADKFVAEFYDPYLKIQRSEEFYTNSILVSDAASYTKVIESAGHSPSGSNPITYGEIITALGAKEADNIISKDISRRIHQNYVQLVTDGLEYATPVKSIIPESIPVTTHHIRWNTLRNFRPNTFTVQVTVPSNPHSGPEWFDISYDKLNLDKLPPGRYNELVDLVPDVSDPESTPAPFWMHLWMTGDIMPAEMLLLMEDHINETFTYLSKAQALGMVYGRGKSPAAPFSNTWHDVGFKVALQKAVELDMPVIGWTTGMQQAERNNKMRSAQDVTDIGYSDGGFGRMGVFANLPGFDRHLIAEFNILEEPNPVSRLAHELNKLDLVGPVQDRILKDFWDAAKNLIADQDHDTAGTQISSTVFEEGEAVIRIPPGFHEVLYDKKIVQSAKRLGKLDGNKPDYQVLVDGNVVWTMPIGPKLKDAIQMSRLSLFQRDPSGVAKGAVEFDPEGRAIITAFKGADVSTAVHELAHVGRKVIYNSAEQGVEQSISDVKILEDAAGVQNGVWTVGAEEWFARAWENYLVTQAAPTTALKGVFKRLKGWMLDIYGAVKGSEIDVELSPEVVSVFDHMLGGGNLQQNDFIKEAQDAKLTQTDTTVQSPERGQTPTSSDTDFAGNQSRERTALSNSTSSGRNRRGDNTEADPSVGSSPREQTSASVTQAVETSLGHLPDTGDAQAAGQSVIESSVRPVAESIDADVFLAESVRQIIKHHNDIIKKAENLPEDMPRVAAIVARVNNSWPDRTEYAIPGDKTSGRVPAGPLTEAQYNKIMAVAEQKLGQIGTEGFVVFREGNEENLLGSFETIDEAQQFIQASPESEHLALKNAVPPEDRESERTQEAEQVHPSFLLMMEMYTDDIKAAGGTVKGRKAAKENLDARDEGRSLITEKESAAALAQQYFDLLSSKSYQDGLAALAVAGEIETDGLVDTETEMEDFMSSSGDEQLSLIMDAHNIIRQGNAILGGNPDALFMLKSAEEFGKPIRELSRQARALSNMDFISGVGELSTERWLKAGETAKGFSRVGKWWFYQGPKYMAAFGPEGAALGRETSRVGDLSERGSSRDIAKIKRKLAGMTVKQREMVGKVMDQRWDADRVLKETKSATQTSKIMRTADAVSEILNVVAIDQATEVGLKRSVVGKDGKRFLVPLKRGGPTLPRKLNAEGRKFFNKIKGSNVHTSPSIRIQATKMSEKTGQPVEVIMKAMVQFRDDWTAGKNPYLFHSRGDLQIWEGYIEFDPLAVLPDQVKQNHRIIEAARMWGNKKRKSGELVDENGNLFLSGWQDKVNAMGATEAGLSDQITETMAKYFNAHFGGGTKYSGMDKHKFVRGFADTLNKYQTLSKLGFNPMSAIRNMTDRFSKGLAAGSVVNNMKATMSFPPMLNYWMKGAQKLREDVAHTGALTGAHELTEFAGHSGKLTDAAMKMFKVVEEGNQTYVALVRKLQVESDLRQLEKLDQRKVSPVAKVFSALDYFTSNHRAAVEYRLGLAGLDNVSNQDLIDWIQSGRELTEDQMLTVFHRAVNDLTFPLTLAIQPIWYANSPSMRSMMKFKSWSVNQTAFSYNHSVTALRHGDSSTFLRWVAGHLLVGAVWGYLQGLISDDDDNIVAEYLNGTLQKDSVSGVAGSAFGALVTGGGIGILADIQWGVTDSFLGVNGGTFKNVIHAVHGTALNPTTIGQQAHQFAKDEVATSKQIGRLMEKVYNAVSPQNTVYVDYHTTRGRAYAYGEKVQSERTGLTGNVLLIGEDLLFGKGVSRRPVGTSAPLKWIAEYIVSGDTDSAALWVQFMLENPVAGKDIESAVKSLHTSQRNRSPLGSLNSQDKRSFLKQFSSEEQSRMIQSQNNWLQTYQTAINKGVKLYTLSHKGN